MDFSHLISVYGYIVVFLLTIINLTTVLVLAGFAVHEGYLNLYWTIIIAAVGSMIFSNLYFYLGRKGAHKLFLKHPDWQAKFERFKSHVTKPWKLLLSVFLFRLIPGFRVITPFLIGPLPIGFIPYAIADFFGAFLWSIIFVLVGYFFGKLAQMFFHQMESYEWYVVGAIIILTIIWWLMHHFYKKYHRTKV